MDEARTPTPRSDVLPHAAAGAAWSWQLTTPAGDSVGGPAPDPSAARRSADFLASAVAALKRTQARRF